jgi:hypothetical protein
MTDSKRAPELPWEGGCRCGKLRFRITRPPLLTMACHCRGCQRMSASAFSLSIAIPSDGFEILAGEAVLGGLHGEGGDDPEGNRARHQHCDWCKAWVFTRIVPEIGFLNVRATMLDDHHWFAPFVETQIQEKLAWANTPAKHSFAGFPPMERYAGLIADYAAETQA